MGEGGNVNNDNDEVANKNNLVVATTAVFILRSAEVWWCLMGMRACISFVLLVLSSPPPLQLA